MAFWKGLLELKRCLGGEAYDEGRAGTGGANDSGELANGAGGGARSRSNSGKSGSENVISILVREWFLTTHLSHKAHVILEDVQR